MRRTLALLWLLLGLLLLLTACEIAPSRRAVSETRTVGPFRATLWSQRKHYHREETIHVRFTLTNISDQEVVLQDEVAPVVDIRMANRLWSQNAGSDRDLFHLVLQPGEEYVIDWIVPGWRQDSTYFLDGLWADPNGEVRLSICHGVLNCP